jgi:GT2 family glycosyltransferase
MDVSIVVVSFKVKDLLQKCLESVYRETQNLEFEVFVVDNNSQDGSVEMVQSNFPKLQLIVNKENIGFAKACNQAIKKSKGEYILFLNPDTEIINNAIIKTSKFMKQKKDAGIAGCKIQNEDGTLQASVRRFPDLLSHIIILLKLHNFSPNFESIKKYYMSGWPYNETKAVDQVMGAFYMIRREVLKTIGLFDEHFYIWYEEVDLCKRALKAGWKTYFFADAQIIHQKGQSFSKRTKLVKQLIFNRSLLYYFFKHHNSFSYLVLLILYPISLIITAVVQLLGIEKKRKEL